MSLGLMNSCKSYEKCESKKIIDDKENYVGDSIICNNRIDKLILNNNNNNLFDIDSVVYKWHTNGQMKGKYTFRAGVKVFENIEYYNSGLPKEYMFINSDNENYFYGLSYDSLGYIIKKSGELFFQGILDKMNAESFEVIDDGRMMHLQIYYPNPPNCETEIYVNLDTIKGDVFKQSEYLSFLKEVWIETKKRKKEWSLVDVWMEQYCDVDTLSYNQPLYYKVVLE